MKFSGNIVHEITGLVINDIKSIWCGNLNNEKNPGTAHGKREFQVVIATIRFFKIKYQRREFFLKKCFSFICIFLLLVYVMDIMCIGISAPPPPLPSRTPLPFFAKAFLNLQTVQVPPF